MIVFGIGQLIAFAVELFLPKFQRRDPYEVALEIRQKCEAVMSEAGVLYRQIIRSA